MTKLPKDRTEEFYGTLFDKSVIINYSFTEIEYQLGVPDIIDLIVELDTIPKNVTLYEYLDMVVYTYEMNPDGLLEFLNSECGWDQIQPHCKLIAGDDSKFNAGVKWPFAGLTIHGSKSRYSISVLNKYQNSEPYTSPYMCEVCEDKKLVPTLEDCWICPDCNNKTPYTDREEMCVEVMAVGHFSSIARAHDRFHRQQIPLQVRMESCADKIGEIEYKIKELQSSLTSAKSMMYSYKEERGDFDKEKNVGLSYINGSGVVVDPLVDTIAQHDGYWNHLNYQKIPH